MNLAKCCLSLVVGLFFVTGLHAVEHLIPPVLSEATIDQKIACTRPMREGKFNISTEEKDGKRIIHCYGHGGAGCTTLWGSVEKAIELYKSLHCDQQKPIRVIGSGIIGLTSAIELVRSGYNVSGITAKELYDIPSWKNAGYFALVSVQANAEEQENMNAISMASYLEYKKIYEGNHPYISADCIRFLPVYCSQETEAGIEVLEQQGLIPSREYCSLDFGNGVVHENFVKYMTYFMDTTRIMMQLRQEIDRLGIAIQEKEIFAFGELPEEIIFNCTGLGGKELNNDDQMVAVRGHLVNLNAQAGTAHMDYMIYSKIQGSDAYVYMFPKCLQVDKQHPEGFEVYATLGGTFIPHTDSYTEAELEELDTIEFKKLLDRNSMFFYGKKL